MLYKMIYFSIHKFAFSNLRFLPFYEHFRQLREKYAFKLKIKYIMLISSLSPIWWGTYIWFFLKKPLHPLHSTELFKIFCSLLTLFTAFLQKACGPGKILKNLKTLFSFINYVTKMLLLLRPRVLHLNLSIYMLSSLFKLVPLLWCKI